jgi:hypothetical protein
MFVGFAPKQIDLSGAAPDRSDLGCSPTFEPAIWAEEMPVELRSKARKAIYREFRSIKFRLYMFPLLLYFEKFSLQMRSLHLRGYSKAAGYLSKFAFN